MQLQMGGMIIFKESQERDNQSQQSAQPIQQHQQDPSQGQQPGAQQASQVAQSSGNQSKQWICSQIGVVWTLRTK